MIGGKRMWRWSDVDAHLARDAEQPGNLEPGEITRSVQRVLAEQEERRRGGRPWRFQNLDAAEIERKTDAYLAEQEEKRKRRRQPPDPAAPQ
jgi:hypothetical protein